MKKFKKNPGAGAPSYKKILPLDAKQQARIRSLVELHTNATALEAAFKGRAEAAKREATMANDSLDFMLATIIECYGGDPKGSYNLVADGTRLEMQ